MTEGFNVAASAVVGIAGLYFAYSWRRRSQVELAEARRAAYAELWQITGLAAPTRLQNGACGTLTKDERDRLYEQLTSWYYRSGQGMLLTNHTRQVYLDAKYNLTCADDQLKPNGTALLATLPAEFTPDQKRGCLSIRQLSLLRTQMKSDLAVYGQPFARTLRQHERDFLRAAKVPLWRKPWRRAMRGPAADDPCQG